MTIRRFLYPSVFVALVPPPTPAAPVPLLPTSVEPIVAFSNTVITDNPTPPSAQRVTPVFSQSPEKPSVGRGLPEALMQDGSDNAPVIPATVPPVFSQSPERPSVGRGLSEALMQDGSDNTPIVPPVAAIATLGPSAHWPIVVGVTLVLGESVTPPQPITAAAVQPYGAFPQDPIKVSYGFPVKLMQDGTDNPPFPPFVVSVFQQSPDIRVKPLNAAQQRLPDLVEVTFPTPQGAYFQPPVVFVKPLNAAQQRFGDFAPVTFVLTPSFWPWSESPVLYAKPFPAAQQRFPDFAPAGFIAVTVQFTQGWYDKYPDLFVKPFPAAQQRFGDFTPAGTVVSVTPQGWWGQPPALFAKPVPASLQRFGDLAPFFFPYTQGEYVQDPVLFWKPTYPASRQQDGGDWSPIAIAVATPGWQFQWPDLFRPPFAAKLQWQGDDFPAQGTIVSTTPQGWMFQDPERFIKPFNAAQQRFEDFGPAGFIVVTPIFTQGWYFQWPEKFVGRFPVSQQRFADFTPLGTIVSTTPQGWWGQSPALFAKPVPAALQFFASANAPQTIVAAAVPQGWMFQSPVLFAKPTFRAYLQRFGDSAPRSYVFTSAIFSQWPECYWKATYPAFRQQDGSDFAPQGSIGVVPQGWWGQPPALFKRPYPTSLQKFSDLHSFVRIAVTPSFFSWTYSPERFVRPLKAAEQMFTGWMPFSPPPPVFVARAGTYDYPVRFVKPFPAAQQQFACFTPFGVILQTVIEGGLKNEVIRVRWLTNDQDRLTYLKNEVERRKTLPTKFDA